MIEILAAIVIISTSFLAVFSTLRICGRANVRVQRLSESILLAESLLAEFSLEDEFAYGSKEGNKGIFSWQTITKPTSLDNLAAIQVTVNWRDQHSLQEYKLMSLKKIELVEYR